MGELFGILSHYIQGKPVFAPLRKVLDLLLSFNIAFFVWDRYYGPIQWQQYDEYPEIMNFVFRGGFLIPICILLLSHFAIKGSGGVMYKILSSIRKVQLQSYISKLKFFKSSQGGGPTMLAEAVDRLQSEKVDKGALVNAFRNMKQADAKSMQNLLDDFKEKRIELRENFNLAWKLLVALSIFKMTIPAFGAFLFFLTTTFAFVAMGVMVLAIKLLDLQPEILRRFAAEAEEHLIQTQETSSGEKEKTNEAPTT